MAANLPSPISAAEAFSAMATPSASNTFEVCEFTVGFLNSLVRGFGIGARHDAARIERHVELRLFSPLVREGIDPERGAIGTRIARHVVRTSREIAHLLLCQAVMN